MLKKLFKRSGEGKGAATQGLIWGGIVALIIVIVAVAVYFIWFNKPQTKTTDQAATTAGNEQLPSANLRYTIITKRDCPGCWDTNLLFDALTANGGKEIGRETVYIDDAATKTLIDKYKITKVPTVLVAGELDKNSKLAQAWPALGEIIDNVFVLRQVIPPYIDVATGQLKGEVSVVYLTDNACKDCYDVKLHDTALANFGITPKSSKTVDVASDEGKALVKKYEIKSVPTIILTGDMEVYASLVQIWATVGQVAKDGAYIFTKMDEMGSYFNLTTNKLVKVTPPATTTGTGTTPQTTSAPNTAQ